MLGLSSWNEIKIFSHEWPFGVGYCTALCELSKKQPAPVQLARETVKRLLDNANLPNGGDEVVASPLWNEHKSCFVSIKAKTGELRGCIGTLSPIHESLDKEIIANAVSASTRDPRFPPMTQDELSNVIFSVDVLSEAEPIESIKQLNPKKYGVIVSKGYRRGVLLPDLEGVDTAEQQVQIAAMKAGIYDLDRIKLERFTVTRYKEV
ncbi:MAG: AmmeMemoRadiSam system protein A [Synergistaceae bacterium]|nr:AmmeMemoRadiSam system protein A [Synergistaceae bacterium]